MSITGSSGEDDPAERAPHHPAVGTEGRGNSAGIPLVPLLDPTVLKQLEKEVGASVTRAFVRDYVGMWHKRLACLNQSLAEDSAESARDAILSIKNSALMLGAELLSRHSGNLERAIGEGNRAVVENLLRELPRIGEQTMDTLQRDYLE